LTNILSRESLEDQPLEICERKGLGHPDTLCDSIMNQVSVELSKEYDKRFGKILHHNLDKGLIAAGQSKVAFKGGEVTQPIKIIYGDRATFNVGNDSINVNEIAFKSTKNLIKEKFRFIDPDEHILYQSEIQPGSIALQDIFEREGRFLGANDTSAAVGFAPMSRMETLIIDLEKHLNSSEFKKRFPESGEDIKLMGLRRKNELVLTVAMAMVDQYIEDEKDYFRKKGEIYESINDFIVAKSDFEEINVTLNALDTHGRGVHGLYLTVLGTSAEAGDSGQVGRGNNVLGIIPLNRPVSSEAAAGKNPVSHVGKIYNLLSYRIANEIIEKVNGIKETYVWLLSEIGQPINKPSIVSTQIIPNKDIALKEVEPQIEEVISYEFENLEEFSRKIAYGEIEVC
jgi:S-adenosylmethionine synthetase